MKYLDFDLQRLSNPKTVDDFEALLDEALSVADDIQACLENLLRAQVEKTHG